MRLRASRPRRRRRRSFTRSTLTVLASVGALAACRDTGADPPGTAEVVEVVDGDTIEVRLAGARETVRLLGIDTPETVAPGQPVGCFGPEASERTKSLLPPGTEVRLTRDVEARDRFDRLLAYVVRADDELFVNRALLAEGFARPLSIAPNDAHRADLSAAAAEARAAGRGLWSACPPDG